MGFPFIPFTHSPRAVSAAALQHGLATQTNREKQQQQQQQTNVVESNTEHAVPVNAAIKSNIRNRLVESCVRVFFLSHGCTRLTHNLEYSPRNLSS